MAESEDLYSGMEVDDDSSTMSIAMGTKPLAERKSSAPGLRQLPKPCIRRAGDRGIRRAGIIEAVSARKHCALLSLQSLSRVVFVGVCKNNHISLCAERLPYGLHPCSTNLICHARPLKSYLSSPLARTIVTLVIASFLALIKRSSKSFPCPVGTATMYVILKPLPQTASCKDNLPCSYPLSHE
jgi:hypothetical protein